MREALLSVKYSNQYQFLVETYICFIVVRPKHTHTIVSSLLSFCCRACVRLKIPIVLQPSRVCVCVYLFLLPCERATYVALVQSSDDAGLLRLCLLRCSHPCDSFTCQVEVDSKVARLDCRSCVRFGDSVCPPTKNGRGCAHKSWHIKRLNLS